MTMRSNGRRCLVAAAMILVAIWSLPYGAVAQFVIPVAGEWNGMWSNSVGESGKDSLILSEDAAGNIRGLWTGEVSVSGRRVNPNTVELRGQTANRSYQMTATLSGTQNMVLNYFATRLDGGGSYQGVSQLSRTR